MTNAEVIAAFIWLGFCVMCMGYLVYIVFQPFFNDEE